MSLGIFSRKTKLLMQHNSMKIIEESKKMPMKDIQFNILIISDILSVLSDAVIVKTNLHLSPM